MSTLTGGEWVVRMLAREGVRHVFGIPGVHNLPIYDALLQQSAITHVLARHEQGAAFMADGYARASGTPGVVVVTSGPAATNTITPLSESYSGSVPVFVIMSDIASGLVGRLDHASCGIEHLGNRLVRAQEAAAIVVVDGHGLRCGPHHREFEHLGWRAEMIDGIPHFIPPYWLDRTQTPQRNTAHDIFV